MTKNNKIKFNSCLWKWRSEGATWHFFTIPYEESVLIKYHNCLVRRGWGAVRVEVKLGKSIWKTSVFPQAESNCYILPVKAQVRKVNNIKEGDCFDIEIEML